MQSSMSLFKDLLNHPQLGQDMCDKPSVLDSVLVYSLHWSVGTGVVKATWILTASSHTPPSAGHAGCWKVAA